MSRGKPRTGRRDDEHGLTPPQHSLTARQTAAERTEPYSIGIAQGNTTRKHREPVPGRLLFQLFLDASSS
ncbi:hypothetical protein HTV80_00270 [Streptomyces sp. Vc74B-19]|uniref:hypothetical protein n=1 Tax=Streptomyces sp. Vc74B-19 TaxID=2741324 RepID=UPI001BFCA0E4|nr:hypothetical protein [Streptomyces sp. Vc74B-19]MBT3161549.1 hypothetical protein [Streptomyces sp. Vc74B-19]